MTVVRRLMLTCAALLLLCCAITAVSVYCMMHTRESVTMLNDYSVPGLFWAAKLKAVACFSPALLKSRTRYQTLVNFCCSAAMVSICATSSVNTRG